MTQEDGTRSLVGLEEAPDGDPELARSLVRHRSQDDDVWPDRTKQPAADAGVSYGPSRIGRSGRLRAVNVWKETEFSAERVEERFPLIEVGLHQFKGHRAWFLTLIVA